jgi:hypothetical protein
VLGLVAARITGNYVVDSLVADTDTRTAAGNAWDILTELLRTSFRWLAVVGILFLVAAWLAGPGRRATATRRALAPALRERVWAYAGLAVLALILLLSSPVSDFTRLFLLAVLIGLAALWIELTRTQTLHEFPNASAPEVFGDARERVTSWWERRRAAPAPAAPAPAAAAAATDLSARLAGLADLHARGELSDDEYAAAKARVLAGE